MEPRTPSSCLPPPCGLGSRVGVATRADGKDNTPAEWGRGWPRAPAERAYTTAGACGSPHPAPLRPQAAKLRYPPHRGEGDDWAAGANRYQVGARHRHAAGREASPPSGPIVRLTAAATVSSNRTISSSSSRNSGWLSGRPSSLLSTSHRATAESVFSIRPRTRRSRMARRRSCSETDGTGTA